MIDQQIQQNFFNTMPTLKHDVEVYNPKTKKKSTPRPSQSMIQMVRPRPSVPVVEPRPPRTIAGQSITRQQTRTSTPMRTSRPTRTRSRGSY